MKIEINYRTKFYNGLTFRIILMFGTAIAYSFLIDYLDAHDALDHVCERYKDMECFSCTLGGRTEYAKGVFHTHWSSRHYLYFWMNLFVMLVQVFRIIGYIMRNLKNGFIVEPVTKKQQEKIYHNGYN